MFIHAEGVWGSTYTFPALVAHFTLMKSTSEKVLDSLLVVFSASIKVLGKLWLLGSGDLTDARISKISEQKPWNKRIELD